MAQKRNARLEKAQAALAEIQELTGEPLSVIAAEMRWNHSTLYGVSTGEHSSCHRGTLAAIEGYLKKVRRAADKQKTETP